MKSYAIALMCLLLPTSLQTLCSADSRIVQHEQVTVFVEDVMYNILGQKTFTYDSTSAPGPTLPGPLSLYFTLGYDSQPTKTLFGDMPLLADAGKTVWVNAACSHPSYSTFVVGLTDGRNDRLSGIFTVDSPLGAHSSTTIRTYESGFFPMGNHDFTGDRIGRIGIRVDSASVSQVPVVVGGIPEPSSASLLLAGLGMSIALWRKRRG